MIRKKYMRDRYEIDKQYRSDLRDLEEEYVKSVAQQETARGHTDGDSPALRIQSEHYPPAWKGKVPRSVFIKDTFGMDIMLPTYVTSDGDVWVVTPASYDPVLLKPGEFEIDTWHELPEE